MMWSLLFTLLAGGGGVVALVVASFFVPSIALVLKAALDFLRSPLGLIVAVTAGGLYLFTAGYVSGDIHGTNKVRAAWRADNAAKAAAADAAKQKLDAKVAADVTAKLQELSWDSGFLKQKVDDVTAAKHPVCVLDADTARRLRNIQ